MGSKPSSSRILKLFVHDQVMWKEFSFSRSPGSVASPSIISHILFMTKFLKSTFKLPVKVPSVAQQQSSIASVRVCANIFLPSSSSEIIGTVFNTFIVVKWLGRLYFVSPVNQYLHHPSHSFVPPQTQLFTHSLFSSRAGGPARHLRATPVE